MVKRLFDLPSNAAWVAIPMRCRIVANNALNQILGGGAQVLQQVPRSDTLPFAKCVREIVDKRLNGFDLVGDVLDHDLGGGLSVCEGIDRHGVLPVYESAAIG